MESLRVLIADERGLVASRLIAQLEGLGHWVIGVAEDGRATEESVARLRGLLMRSACARTGRERRARCHRDPARCGGRRCRRASI